MLGFRRSDAAADRARMHRLLADRAAAGVLVGMPLLGRSAGKDSGSMKEFVEMYTHVVLEGVEVAVAFVDESYTTQMARMKVEEARPPALRRDARRRKEAMDAVGCWTFSVDAYAKRGEEAFGTD